MTPLVFALLAIAGGAGAAARFFVDGLLRTHLRTKFVWATTIVNVSGSLVLGVLTGIALANFAPHEIGIVLGTGFLGGYTTFSTASYETLQLIRQRRLGASLMSGFGMLVIAVIAALLGLWMGAGF